MFTASVIGVNAWTGFLVVMCTRVAWGISAEDLLARWRERVEQRTPFVATCDFSEELRFENSQRDPRYTHRSETYALDANREAYHYSTSVSGDASKSAPFQQFVQTLMTAEPSSFIRAVRADPAQPPQFVEFSEQPSDRHMQAKFISARRIAEYAYTDHIPVYEIMANAGTASVTSDNEIVDGVPCVVLHADTPHGTYTVWLDPASDCLWRRVTVHKEGDDLQWEQPMSANASREDNPKMPYPMTGVESYDLEIKNIVIEEIDGNYVIKQATEEYTQVHLSGETVHATRTTKVGDIEFDPDFDSLGIFELDIPSGTPVDHLESNVPGAHFIWKDGTLALDVDVSREVTEGIDHLADEVATPPSSGAEEHENSTNPVLPIPADVHDNGTSETYLQRFTFAMGGGAVVLSVVALLLYLRRG